jgi:hypothetical protein
MRIEAKDLNLALKYYEEILEKDDSNVVGSTWPRLRDNVLILAGYMEAFHLCPAAAK